MFCNKKKKYSFFINNNLEQFIGTADSKTLVEYNIKIGDNVDINPKVIIGTNTHIGNNVKINELCKIDGATIANDCILGRNCNIGRCVQIGHNTIIGNNCSIENEVIIEENCIFKKSVILLYKCYISANTIIGNDSLLYAGVRVNDSSIIGSNVSIYSKALIDIGSIIANKTKIIDKTCLNNHNDHITQESNKVIYDYAKNIGIAVNDLQINTNPEYVKILSDGKLEVLLKKENSDYSIITLGNDDFNMTVSEYKEKIKNTQNDYKLYLTLKDKFEGK